MPESHFNWEEVTALATCTVAVAAFAVWSISAIVDKKLTAFLLQIDSIYARDKIIQSEIRRLDARVDGFHRVRNHS